MYICPTCNQQFNSEDAITKHSLKCWREYNPNIKSKPAPHSNDIITRKCTDDITNFFNLLQ